MKIGIIGGSGLDKPNILKEASERIIQTPFGKPSSAIKEGNVKNISVAILARHGMNHSISPSNVNYRANIWAMKEIGCTHILASTAVGSLREDIKPGHLVFPNQFIDNTRHRISTFFDQKQVIHTPMADPFCPQLLKLLKEIAEDLKIPYHTNKTVISVEGPRFSTRSESFMFRSWKADIINMSSCPEVALAREQKIHYASLAMATDYDCWKKDEESVSWEMIKKTMDLNSKHVINILLNIIPKIKIINDICVN